MKIGYVTRIAVVAAVSALVTGCSTTPSAPSTPAGTQSAAMPEAIPAPRVDIVQLPAGAWPRLITVGPDGALWVAESSGNAIARLRPGGEITHFRIPGTQNSPGDIVVTPDGTPWYTGFQQIGRLDAQGNLTRWGLDSRNEREKLVGLPNALAVGPDGAIWYTNETVPPSITRVDPSGSFTRLQFASGTGGFSLPGIISGPDGALWFTEQPVGPEDPVNAIGRMTVDGVYSRSELADPRADPTRITAGPDGALWFTEQSGNIGRITVNGMITEFPLTPGTRPFDIVTGEDDALWFTVDDAVGRITTTGDIEMFPIAGATQLIGIAAAADGTLWLSEGETSILRHFTPPSR